MSSLGSARVIKVPALAVHKTGLGAWRFRAVQDAAGRRGGSVASVDGRFGGPVQGASERGFVGRAVRSVQVGSRRAAAQALHAYRVNPMRLTGVGSGASHVSSDCSSSASGGSVLLGVFWLKPDKGRDCSSSPSGGSALRRVPPWSQWFATWYYTTRNSVIYDTFFRGGDSF